MKLTNATEQALAIMAMLAVQHQSIPVSSETIYTKLAVSPSYVKKLLRKLVVARLIGGVSGNNGGFYLEKAPSDISLLEIVEAIEGPFTSFPDRGVLQRAFTGLMIMRKTVITSSPLIFQKPIAYGRRDCVKSR